MATQSSILAWEILWTEEPGGLQSMGWQRVGHDGMTEHTHKICISPEIPVIFVNPDATREKRRGSNVFTG